MSPHVDWEMELFYAVDLHNLREEQVAILKPKTRTMDWDLPNARAHVFRGPDLQAVNQAAEAFVHSLERAGTQPVIIQFWIQTDINEVEATMLWEPL